MSAPDRPPGKIRIQLGARRERIALLAGLALLLLAGLPLFWLARPDAARARVQVLAHRGASAYAPENTLAAFRLAIEQRADWLEVDVQQTRDGRLVAFHDLRVERTTNGRGTLRELTLEQVRALDAGTWFGAQFAGEPVPTFEEVVELARAHNVKLFPEVKDPRLYPGIEERVAAVLRAYEYEDRTVVQSFDQASLARMRAINPRLKLAALYTAANPLRGDPPPGISIIGPPWESVVNEPAIVREAHAAGRQVVVWSVDGAAPVGPLLAARVDGIITGRPDLVRAILDGRAAP